MNPDTLLWRQIHPSFLEGGRPGSQAFRPTPKDHDRLSFDDGDRIKAEASWWRFTETKGLQSVGVLGVHVAECTAEELSVEVDGIPDPEHVSVNFSGQSNGKRKTISKKLRDLAMGRGWQFAGPDSGVA